MSFRQDNTDNLRWRPWLAENRETLTLCGLPDFILDSQHHWVLILHAGYDVLTGWKPEKLSRDQQEELYNFVSQRDASFDDDFLQQILERLLGIAPSSLSGGP